MRAALLLVATALLLSSAPTASADTRCEPVGPQVSVCDASFGECDHTFVVLHGTGTLLILQQCEGADQTTECVLAVTVGWCDSRYHEQGAEFVYLVAPLAGYQAVYTEDEVYSCVLLTPAGAQPCPAGTERLLPGPSDLGLGETWGHVLP